MRPSRISLRPAPVATHGSNCPRRGWPQSDSRPACAPPLAARPSTDAPATTPPACARHPQRPTIRRPACARNLPIGAKQRIEFSYPIHILALIEHKGKEVAVNYHDAYLKAASKIAHIAAEARFYQPHDLASLLACGAHILRAIDSSAKGHLEEARLQMQLASAENETLYRELMHDLELIILTSSPKAQRRNAEAQAQRRRIRPHGGHI